MRSKRATLRDHISKRVVRATWPSEIHLLDNEITPEYWKWRQAGMNNTQAVRYPVGFKHRHEVAFSVLLDEDNNVERLDYIQSRKRLYLPWYVESVKHLPQFEELQNKLARGENLLIIEPDGPHQESLQYYLDTYNVVPNFIERTQ